MVKILCENYNVIIEEKLITLEPMVANLPPIIINANEKEDFSIFDLGPLIANHVIISTASCRIDEFDYEQPCIVVDQEPANFIQIVIREYNPFSDRPVDSGNIIYTFKDYVVKYLD